MVASRSIAVWYCGVSSRGVFFTLANSMKASAAAVLFTPSVVVEIGGRVGVLDGLDVGLRYSGAKIEGDVNLNIDVDSSDGDTVRVATNDFLATGGDDFAVMGMHFKLGLYEHQSAGAIQGLITGTIAAANALLAAGHDLEPDLVSPKIRTTLAQCECQTFQHCAINMPAGVDIAKTNYCALGLGSR